MSSVRSQTCPSGPALEVVQLEGTQAHVKKTLQGSGLTAFWRLGSSTGASGYGCYDSQKKPCRAPGLRLSGV